MVDVKFDDYKLSALLELVTIDKFLNPNAIGLTDEEARKKGLWKNTDKLPSEEEIKEKFEEIKPKLQAEADNADRQRKRELFLPEIEIIGIELKKQDNLLGFKNERSAIEFIFERDYGDAEVALELIKQNVKR